MPSPEYGVGNFEHQTVISVLDVWHQRLDSAKRISEFA
jgi:hypothetical protein